MQYFLHSSPLALVASLLACGDIAVATSSSASSSSSAGTTAPTGATYTSGFDMSTSWANLSPYRDANSFSIPKGAPRGCELSQAHILHRHAQRYPTPSDLDLGPIENFAKKLQNYSKAHPKAHVGRGPLAFLDNWENFLGEELLVTSGAATEATAGAYAWANYGRLLYRAGPEIPGWEEKLNVYPNGTSRPKPVFRTTDQARILESARWWASGFFGNIGANSSYSQYDLVVMSETGHLNNTLAAANSCPGDSREGYQGDNTAKEFIPKFTKDAKTRLARFLPADFNLTTEDVLAMQTLCPYETAIMGNSAFCSLFTEQEWLDFNYNIDIQYYGDYSFGASTGRAQGIGYVLELAARLQGKLIHSSDTSINYTFDNNEAQFPLNQPLYMDMSHDSNIISVLTALGLQYFNYGPHGLPPLAHAPPRKFSTSQVSPYGTHLVSEIWTCPSHASLSQLDPVLYQNPDLSSASGGSKSANTTDYIRFVLNGAPLPLEGVDGCQDSSVNGFCAVPEFLDAVPKMKKYADYQHACFGKHFTGPEQVGDGRPVR